MEANGNVNNQKSSFVAKTAVMSDDKSKKKNILKGIFPKKKRSILRKSTSKKVSTILENLKLLRTMYKCLILWIMHYYCNLLFL